MAMLSVTSEARHPLERAAMFELPFDLDATCPRQAGTGETRRPGANRQLSAPPSSAVKRGSAHRSFGPARAARPPSEGPRSIAAIFAWLRLV